MPQGRRLSVLKRSVKVQSSGPAELSCRLRCAAMAKILPRPEHSDDIRINVRAVVTHEDFIWRSPALVDKLIEKRVRRNASVKDLLFRGMESHGQSYLPDTLLMMISYTRFSQRSLSGHTLPSIVHHGPARRPDGFRLRLFIEDKSAPVTHA